MSRPRALPEHLPHWPRRLSVDLAAAYLGISASKFLADVGADRYPPPIKDGARILWDRMALDEAVDSQAGRSHTGNPLLKKLRERHARS